MDADHGDLDQFGGGPLDGHIHGHALVGAAQPVVAGSKMGDLPPPSQDGADVAIITGLGQQIVDELTDAGIGVKVVVDEVLPLLDGDIELLRHAKRPGPVHDTEIHHLGCAAHIGRHLPQGDAKNHRRRLAMDVLCLFKGLKQGTLLGQMGHDAQFDLRVVR